MVSTGENFVNWGVDNQGGLWFYAGHPETPIPTPEQPDFWQHVPFT
jgi:hypothetical protein